MSQYRITTNGVAYRIEELKKRWFRKSYYWKMCWYNSPDLPNLSLPAVFDTQEEAKDMLENFKAEERSWVEVR